MTDDKRRRSKLEKEKGAGHTVDRVIDYILSRIRSGEFGQGQQIIARNIAATLGVSAAPVREALHQLSGEGVIELFSNRSARVRQLSLEEVLNALEVWGVHAAFMARLTAERIKIRDNADRIRAATRKIHEARQKNDIKSYHSAIIQFQETMSAITGNPYIEAVRKCLHTEFWTPQFGSFLPSEDHEEYLARFDQIENAILSGNPDEAQDAYESHLRWVIEKLRQTYYKRVSK